MNTLMHGTVMTFIIYFMQDMVSSQNVGIGTSIPTAMLNIAGNMKINGPNTLEFGARELRKLMLGKLDTELLCPAPWIF